MPNAIRFHHHGDPDVLRWESVDVGEPGPKEVRIRHTAIGLNFIDIYERTGLYQTQLPTIPGREAAGVIEAVGSSVRDLAVGDRVAYAGNGGGAYAEVRVMPVWLSPSAASSSIARRTCVASSVQAANLGRAAANTAATSMLFHFGTAARLLIVSARNSKSRR